MWPYLVPFLLAENSPLINKMSLIDKNLPSPYSVLLSVREIVIHRSFSSLEIFLLSMSSLRAFSTAAVCS
ncbi:MAG: hypothetical protein QG577_556, partial [Thermodesulfobacteriota bacterium]|nr:hypothetical protein [Thermodesulfobacteriota bacterium]